MDPNFDFDVAAADAPWMNALEDGVLSVHSRRSRTPVQLTVPGAAVREFRDQIEAAVNSRRSRTPVQPAAAQAPFHADHLNARMVVPVRNRLEVGMTLLTEMGMLEVYGGDLCRFMLERYEGNIDRAVEGLTALGGPQ